MTVLIATIHGIILVEPSDYSHMLSNATTHCSWYYEPNGQANLKKSFQVVYALGFIIGSMLTSKELSIYWTITSWWKRLIRYLITIILNLGLIILFEMIPTNDLYADISLHYIFPYFLMSFIYAGILPALFIKIGIASKIKPIVDEERELSKFENKIII